MFFEDTFGNIFGIIWLIIFVGGVVALILWLTFREEKEKKVIAKEECACEPEKETINELKENEVVEEKKEIIEENNIVEEEKKEIIEENNIIQKEVVAEVKYRIESGEDGFFRVKKVGDNRTIRKFSTKLEAINYVNEKGTK